MNNMSTVQGQVTSIQKQVTVNSSAAALFSQLSESLSLQNVMLLESAEIESKNNIKSILMLQAAVRIECNANNVILTALTKNGEQALSFIQQVIVNNKQLHVQHDSNHQLSIEYANSAENNLDQDSLLVRTTPIDILRQLKDQFTANSNSDYSIFLCGVFAFDFIANFESLPKVKQGSNTCPDFVFYLAETLLVIDHQSHSSSLISNQFHDPYNNEQFINEKIYNDIASRFKNIELAITSSSKVNASYNKVNAQLDVNFNDQQFADIVNQLKQNIVAGDIFQVVPSRTFSIECPSPIQSYLALKQSNPSPYMFFMQDKDFSLFGASPESALKYEQKNNQVLLYPIAGTRPRGKKSNGNIDYDLDSRIEAELKLDQKEVAEHMMLVDLARNDIARISQSGTINIPRLLSVDRYSQVMHLVSCVQGQLKPNLDALHAYQACMNMGTLSGAPKIKATELIRQVEQERRGSYGGAVGYINGKGDMDTCIVIRSAFCRDNKAYIQAGAGVVFDSVAENETLETQNKAQAVINAILTANQQLNNTHQSAEEQA